MKQPSNDKCLNVNCQKPLKLETVRTFDRVFCFDCEKKAHERVNAARSVLKKSV